MIHWTLSGIEIKDQSFAEIVTENGPTLSSAKFDGVLGLGHDVSSVKHTVPPFYQMINHGLVDEPVFSFWLNSGTEKEGGELVLGGTDPSHYEGELVWSDLRYENSWEITLEDIKFEGSYYGVDAATAVIDTGTFFFIVPTVTADLINQILGGRMGRDGTYILDCDKIADLPELCFVFSGKDYCLVEEEYVIKEQDECISGILSRDVHGRDGYIWTIGTVFLRKFYSVYDFGNKRIGFAKSK